jgi:hypothetical protein
MNENNNAAPTGGNPLAIEGNTPFETGATVFGIFTPRFEALVKELSTGELRRLSNALVQYPLNEKEFIEDRNPRLKEAFRLGNEIIRARSIMEFETLIKIQEEKMKKEQENKEKENG